MFLSLNTHILRYSQYSVRNKDAPHKIYCSIFVDSVCKETPSGTFLRKLYERDCTLNQEI